MPHWHKTCPDTLADVINVEPRAQARSRGQHE